ncbi:MAG: glycosyltransferase, partial [Actinomycetota bacterium]
CRAVLFTPVREDFGYVAIEAGRSGKPVITCTDSGEPARLIEHGRSGYVCHPSSGEMARAIELLAQDEELATRLGKTALEDLWEIRWDVAVSKLLACLSEHEST